MCSCVVPGRGAQCDPPLRNREWDHASITCVSWRTLRCVAHLCGHVSMEALSEVWTGCVCFRIEGGSRLCSPRCVRARWVCDSQVGGLPVQPGTSDSDTGRTDRDFYCQWYRTTSGGRRFRPPRANTSPRRAGTRPFRLPTPCALCRVEPCERCLSALEGGASVRGVTLRTTVGVSVFASVWPI